MDTKVDTRHKSEQNWTQKWIQIICIINDPAKRDRIVQDFISRKNRIKGNFKQPL